MKQKWTGPRFSWHEITPEPIFRQRRQLLKGVTAAALAATPLVGQGAEVLPPGTPLDSVRKLSLDEDITPAQMALKYNNFYELGLGKEDPQRNAHLLQTDPWSVTVSGACDKPGTYTLEDILRPHAIEQRVYRLRCVEAWSMVIPWDGFSLGDLLKRFAPNSRAKYVAFKTLLDPDMLPGQRSPVLEWPYREGLRMDEAMHPLAMMVVGAYGEALRGQMGAPLRLMVPWKYGFKSIKSIVGIEFTEQQPKTSWNMSAPREYGFYANVNPEVDHPRWSQASERRIDASSSGLRGLFAGKQPTLMFNGYADSVASLYSGMDLRNNY